MKLKHDKPLSNLTFNFNLWRYTKEGFFYGTAAYPKLKMTLVGRYRLTL